MLARAYECNICTQGWVTCNVCTEITRWGQRPEQQLGLRWARCKCWKLSGSGVLITFLDSNSCSDSLVEFFLEQNDFLNERSKFRFGTQVPFLTYAFLVLKGKRLWWYFSVGNFRRIDWMHVTAPARSPVSFTFVRCRLYPLIFSLSSPYSSKSFCTWKCFEQICLSLYVHSENKLGNEAKEMLRKKWNHLGKTTGSDWADWAGLGL